MKKTLISILLASIIIIPLSSYALNIDDIKNSYRVISSIANKYKNLAITNKLNVKGYIYNSSGKFKIKDALTVTENALFKKNVEINGYLEVDGDITADNLINYTAGDNVTISEDGIISATNTGTNTTYTAGTGITIDENGVIASTVVDTDTNTTYTAGNGIALNGTELSVDIDSADVGLGNVENTALSTWAGTSNITTLGTIATGTWNGASLSDSYIDNNITASSYLPLAGGTMTGDLDIGGSNIKYLSTTDDINTAIAAASAGDTLILAAGTYTVTANIDVDKSMSIIGQGKGITTITTTTDSIKVFEITASNVVVQNLSIDVTASGTNGIWIDGTADTVLNGVIIENVDVTLNSHAGNQYAVRSVDASGEMRDMNIIATSSDVGAFGLSVSADPTAEAETTLRVFNLYILVTGSGGSHAVRNIDNSSSEDVHLYINNSSMYSNGYCLRVNNGDAYVYAENSVFDGTVYDLDNVTGALLRIRNSILVNGTTTGTITYSGERTTKTPVTLYTDATVTLTAQDCLDGYYINNDDDPITFNLPAAEDGLKVSFGNIAYNQSIKVQPNNGDVIILNDGSSVSDPGWVYSSGALDDKGTFVAIDGNAWILWDEQNIWALVTGT